ncbi:MAG TPA: hypothetical protein VNN77_12705 [candidate division Zixibacteria bacterium]|nr:hypothetical protein [candidate division Zixibacteria bacterium]
MLLVQRKIIPGVIALALWSNAGAAQVAPAAAPQAGPREAEEAKRDDDALIRGAVLQYGSRAAASRALAGLGWDAFRRGALDAAMERFRQSRILNPGNYQAYWGEGAVLNERGKVREAIDQLERARELIDDPKQRARLLADLGALHSEYAVRLGEDRQLERARHFVAANQRFTESAEADPGLGMSWREWAISLYAQQRYEEAWTKAKRAQELRAEPFPEQFLERLRAKVQREP